MDCIGKCGRILIVVLNIVFLLIGLVIFGLGMLLKFGFDKVQPYLDHALDFVKEQLKTLAQSSGTSMTNLGLPTNVDLKEVDELVDILEAILKDVAVALIAVGAVILVLVLLGLCGACYKIKIFLYIYSTVIFLLLIAMVTVTGLYLNKRTIIDDKVKPILKASIKDSYGGLKSADFVSLAWNFAMQQFSCCGVDNSDDFKDAPKWEKNPLTSVILKAPLTCCKDIPAGEHVSDLVCATNPNESNSNYKTGCYDVLWSYVEKYNKYVMTIVIIVSLIEALIIFLGCWIACKTGEKSKVGHMDD